jgi:hypothetical protein
VTTSSATSSAILKSFGSLNLRHAAEDLQATAGLRERCPEFLHAIIEKRGGWC